MMIPIKSQRLKRLFDYWVSKRAGEKLPARVDISPAEIPDLLDRLFLVDVERKPYRFRYRLAGSALYQAANTEITGAYLSPEMAGRNYDDIFNVHVKTIEAADAHFGISLYERPMGASGSVTVEAVFLPLADDGATVNMLLCTQDMLMDGWIRPDILSGLLQQPWITLVAGERLTSASFCSSLQ